MEGYLITHPDGQRVAIPKIATTTRYLQKVNAVEKEDKKIKYVIFPSEDAAIDYIVENGQFEIGYSSIPRVASLQGVVKEQQSEIDFLRSEIDRLNEKKGDVAPLVFITAPEVIAKVLSASTITEVEEIINGDTRKTVIDAGELAKKRLLNK